MGIATSSGIAIGNICVLEQTQFTIKRKNIDEHHIDDEIANLIIAIGRTQTEIQDLRIELKEKLSEQEDKIFNAHEMILEDRYFISEITDLIVDKRYCAQYAVDFCIQRYIQLLSESDNEYAKQRIHDLRDIESRLIRNLEDEKGVIPVKITENSIVVINELTPSLSAVLVNKKPAGVTAEKGAGKLSHAGIILKSLEIPTLNDIPFKMLCDFKGKNAIIDGFNGLLIVNPTIDEVEKYREELTRLECKRLEERKNTWEYAVTRDGYKIGLYANISNFSDYSQAVRKKVDGIGLVRTEMLFINSKKAPNERNQFFIYSRIAKNMNQKPVVIRTADFGGDKIPAFADKSVNTGNLDQRGIESINKEQFVVQLKSILRASEHGNISITFPMVNNAEEIRVIKGIVNKVRDELLSKGEKLTRQLSIGIFVETSSAVDNLDGILSEVEFISIGTNDLLQQVLNIKRDDSSLPDYEYLNPRFLSIIKYCIDKANVCSKSVAVCGEMAADPVAAIILLGMGASYLSISPAMAMDVNMAIRGIRKSDAEMLAAKSLLCATADEVKNMIQEWMCSSM